MNSGTGCNKFLRNSFCINSCSYAFVYFVHNIVSVGTNFRSASITRKQKPIFFFVVSCIASLWILHKKLLNPFTFYNFFSTIPLWVYTVNIFHVRLQFIENKRNDFIWAFVRVQPLFSFKTFVLRYSQTINVPIYTAVIRKKAPNYVWYYVGSKNWSMAYFEIAAAEHKIVESKNHCWKKKHNKIFWSFQAVTFASVRDSTAKMIFKQS